MPCSCHQYTEYQGSAGSLLKEHLPSESFCTHLSLEETKERNSTITKSEPQSTLLEAFYSPGPTASRGSPDTTVDLFIYLI